MKKNIYIILEKIVARLVIHLLKVSGSFATYLVKTIAEYGFEHLIVPALNSLLRSGLYVYDNRVGEIKAKKLIDAREGGSNADYDDAVDDILG